MVIVNVLQAGLELTAVKHVYIIVIAVETIPPATNAKMAIMAIIVSLSALRVVFHVLEMVNNVIRVNDTGMNMVQYVIVGVMNVQTELTSENVFNAKMSHGIQKTMDVVHALVNVIVDVIKEMVHALMGAKILTMAIHVIYNAVIIVLMDKLVIT